FAALARARPNHVGPPARRRYHVLYRAPPAGAREVVGVLSLRQHRKAQALAGPQMRQREVGGAIGRLLAGAVAIETEDRLVRHLPEQRELVFGGRRAEPRPPARKTRRPPRHEHDITPPHDKRPPGLRRPASQ